MKTKPAGFSAAALLALLIPLIMSGSLFGHASALPTSATGSQPSAASQFRGHPTLNSGYDEQIGITFTQNFSSLEYNVTAVEQIDPTLGTGPGYLLSGLSDTGAWYQVGLSWDWSPGVGFAMSYEVFDQFGNSVFPQNGGGGLAAFSGPVNPGDNVTLDLYFSSGDVVMQATDTSTGATAQESYTAGGGTYFVGEPNSDANSVGFFTGLMTEWYHGQPYYSNPDEVVFSSSAPVSSGWLWMDEFNADNGQLVFASNATTVSSFSASPTELQEFSYGSVTEYGDAFDFVTGGSTNSTTSSSSSTVTAISTEVVTAVVSTTITQTATTTATTTKTVTQPTTTTVTSTQPTTTILTTTQPPVTTTTTQTTTQTATGIGSLPAWSYGLMILLLGAGLGAGYLLRRPAQSPTWSSAAGAGVS